MQPAAADDVQMENSVHGHCDARFGKVADALADALSSGEELGAAIAIDIDGEMVVDIWGGHADAARTKQWAEHTIVNVWSSTKTVTSLTALMLVDRGLVDLNTPVARYWPEFAVNGKQDIEVRHILSHTSGVSGWDAPFTIEDVYDWDKSTSQLARQAPWWPPGTASGYHALTFGHLIGELVRRTAGMSLKDFVRDEIARPLEADFQIGALADEHDRIAELIPPPPFDIPFDALPEDSPMRKTFTTPRPDAEVAHTARWRAADIGAVNGHGNARSLARTLSPISLGGKANGVQLLRPKTIEQIFTVQSKRYGPGVGRAAAVGCWLRFAHTQDRANGARREDLLLGRLGWLDGAHQPGPPYHGCLCDEQDGPGHARKRAHREVRVADLRGPGLTARREAVQHISAECAQIFPG